MSSGHTSSGSDEVTREAVLRARAAIAEHERTVPDFPKPGILFRDLTPVLADTESFSSIVTALTHGCSGVDLVAGIDARGFLVGGAVAQELEVGILAVRKGGKLPPPVHRVEYDLEYGSAALEIPADDSIPLRGKKVFFSSATGAAAPNELATYDYNPLHYTQGLFLEQAVNVCTNRFHRALDREDIDRIQKELDRTSGFQPVMLAAQAMQVIG